MPMSRGSRDADGRVEADDIPGRVVMAGLASSPAALLIGIGRRGILFK